MRTAGAEKQDWGFGRNEATVRAAARRGPEDDSQGDEAGFKFVPGQIFRRRDFQETGQQFFLLRHRQNQMQLKFSRSVLQADNKRYKGNSADAGRSSAESSGRRTANRAMGPKISQSRRQSLCKLFPLAPRYRHHVILFKRRQHSRGDAFGVV